MWIDSHCHLNYDGLSQELAAVLKRMADAQVSHALCIGVTPKEWPDVLAIAESHACLFATIGVHPDQDEHCTVKEDTLIAWADSPKVVGIGETGLDYYRAKSTEVPWQMERFRAHIRAARHLRLPLVIHTRASAEDTLHALREEGTRDSGGVMHCFTESWEVAKQALDLGFYISLSGIVTFKNARLVHELAQRVPLDRLLVETDAPFLAPVPYRGKRNEPAYVAHVGKKIADLRGISIEQLAQATSENFFRLFYKTNLST